MRVRQIDSNHDWTFGKGQNNYVTRRDAVKQNLNTRILQFLGNCFFDQGAGIDWFNLLGGKDTIAINLAVSAVILNTQDVTGLQELSLDLNRSTRALIVSYKVDTVYGTLVATFQQNFSTLIG